MTKRGSISLDIQQGLGIHIVFISQIGSCITIAEISDFFIYNSIAKAVKKNKSENKGEQNQTMQNGYGNGTTGNDIGLDNKAFSTRV